MVNIVEFPILFPAYPFDSGVPVGEPGTNPDITTLPTGSDGSPVVVVALFSII